MSELTQAEKVLLAAKGLAESFMEETLIVEVWLKYPQEFGLRMYAELYPDSKRIISALCGNAGPMRRGWIYRPSPKIYRVTSLGRAELDRLHGRINGTVAPKTKVSRKVFPADLDAGLARLFASGAYLKWPERVQDWTFVDASMWWRLEEPGAEAVFTTLSRADAFMAGERAILKSGQVVGPLDIADLRQIDADLRKRFDCHLKLLANRGKKVNA